MSDFMDLPKALAHLAARNAPARAQGENRHKRSSRGILSAGQGICEAGEKTGCAFDGAINITCPKCLSDSSFHEEESK